MMVYVFIILGNKSEMLILYGVYIYRQMRGGKWEKRSANVELFCIKLDIGE